MRIFCSSYWDIEGRVTFSFGKWSGESLLCISFQVLFRRERFINKKVVLIKDYGFGCSYGLDIIRYSTNVLYRNQSPEIAFLKLV